MKRWLYRDHDFHDYDLDELATSPLEERSVLAVSNPSSVLVDRLSTVAPSYLGRPARGSTHGGSTASAPRPVVPSSSPAAGRVSNPNRESTRASGMTRGS